jgi:hypothetical protein
MRRFLLLAASIWAWCPALAGGFPYEAFPATTFAALVADEKSHEAELNPSPIGSNIFHPPVRARVTATYLGRQRPLSAERLKQIATFAEAYKIDDTWVASFKSEYLFSSEGRDWWLPVQQPVAAFFKDQLPKGKAADLYLIYGGATKRADGWQMLLVVEEFQTLQ